jgi:L-alanine-DL-glutamate epimerase-like enolase superfamily enzyme
MQAKLTITDVERIVVDVPFTPRCQPWNALLVRDWRVVEVIRVITDAGFIGYGETLLHYTWGRVPQEADAQVKGGNPADFLGDDRLGAGLQMALYDVVGQALGVPIHKLFNLPQVRQWCPIAWWNTKMPPEVLADEAREAVAQGYTAHKFKARPWIDVYAQVEAVSSVTPKYYRLDLDWNEMLLNAGNATPVLTELDRYERVAIYESPIFHRDVEGYQHLRRKVLHPIAIHYGQPSFLTAVRAQVCDGFVVSGGVSGVLEKGILAGKFEKPFWLQLVGTGLTTALLLHLGAVLPLAQWPGVSCLNNYSDDLLVEPLDVAGGHMRVPEGPGLGIGVDEAALVRYRMAPPYEIPPPRQLLSVVWPGGRVVHYADMRDGLWADFRAGNQPVQERGVRLEILPDDGTAAWAELYARAKVAPVRDRRQ